MSAMADRQDTIVAVATPPGKSGIGIVRLSGSAGLAIAREITHIDARPRYAHYCAFRDRAGRILDKGILLYFKAPHSFTGEDVVELHGHGGPGVLSLLLKEAVALGARLARAGEFTERAYLNDKIDLVQAEAVADLIDSVSARAVRSAARSLEGEFSERISGALAQLVNIRTYVEGALDFPEEEADFLKNRELDQKLDQLVTYLDDLLIKSRRGRLLREGVRAAIVGRPNVGKSSLLNRLTQTNRAIVTDVAGTTRDIIEDTIQIDGTPVNIVDTAGIREPVDMIEQEGVKRSYREIEKADLIILVTDINSDENDDVVEQLFREKPSGCKLIVVHNKIDLAERVAGEADINGVRHLYISAMTGDGLDLLRAALKQEAGMEDAGEDVVLARERHINALETARRFVEAGMQSFKSDGPAELLAEELRKAQQTLGQITGEFHTDDLLGEIFSRFCIGK